MNTCQLKKTAIFPNTDHEEKHFLHCPLVSAWHGAGEGGCVMYPFTSPCLRFETQKKPINLSLFFFRQ
jgi:hypothetical protein